MNRSILIEKIRSNINSSGFHISAVNQDLTPRFAYTIGLFEILGFELIYAGGMNFLLDDINVIINSIGSSLLSKKNNSKNEFIINKYGLFNLTEVHQSWSKNMLLGAHDYYNVTTIPCFQINPISNNKSLDTPTMNIIYDEKEQTIWSWMTRDFNWNVPKLSKCIINNDILFGAKALEIMRWEEDEWEVFTSNSQTINEEDMRIIPLTTLIGIDITLMRILELEVGKGLIRELPTNEWENWG